MPARTHGKSTGGTKGKHQSIYKIWSNIKQRCFNPDNPRYKDYGGRGVIMCDRWRDSFEEFFSYVGDRPKGKSLDRIDNNGNYEPGNVRWTTTKEQNINSRRAVMVTLNGKTQCINDWCKEIGLAYVTYKQRRRKGWGIVKAATTPPDTTRKRKQ